MQTLTDAEKAIIRAPFQAAASGYRARLEVDHYVDEVTVIGGLTDLNLALGTCYDGGSSHQYGCGGPDTFWGWTNPTFANDGNVATVANRTNGVTCVGAYGFGGAYSDGSVFSILVSDLGAELLVDAHAVHSDHAGPSGFVVEYSVSDGVTWLAAPAAADWVLRPGGATPSIYDYVLDTPTPARYWRFVKTEPVGSGFRDGIHVNTWEILGYPTSTVAAHLTPSGFVPSRASRDCSRRMAAAQLEIEIPLELAAGTILTADGALRTNAPCRLYQWHGDDANEVLAFSGLIDVLTEARDPRNLAFAARDMLKPAIEATASVTAPQGSGEAGAIRTTANYVYLDMEATDIVEDLLVNKAGYDPAMLDLAPSSYLLTEYIVGDGASIADAIIGDEALSGLTGYELRATEAGRVTWGPSNASKAPDSDTAPTPDYSYEVAYAGADPLTSRNVLNLSHAVDEYDLRTRVRVTGSLAIIKDAWTEVWHTNLIRKPVGVWYDPSDTTHIRVLDKGTKRLYRLKISPSPRAIVSSVALPGTIDYPIGLSGDPGDAAHYWILEAPFWTTGGTAGNYLHKMNVAGNTIAASYALPAGKWTSVKVSATAVYLTSWSDDKLHVYSKVGVSIAAYTISYLKGHALPQTGLGTAQVNPTGVMVDGTDIYVFFYGTNRFLKVSEGALQTITKVISTAGTKILGGEMNTTTHTEMWGDSDALGLVWQYTLAEPSTREISVELVDGDLEDELGILSGRGDRIHDSHPGDPAHPFEIRRETIRLTKVIDTLSQATETGQRRLAALAHRREVLDQGIVGNPGHQIGDLIAETDPATGIDALYVIDTYRDDMSDQGYIGALALLPYEPVF